MNRTTGAALTIVLAATLLLGATGCAKRDSSAELQSNMDKVQADGARDVAAAQKTADDKMADVRGDLDKAQRAADHQAADVHRNLSVAEADAAHKVSLEQCDAQSGDARSSCKKIADAEFASNKAHAELTKAVHDPTP